jgi:hypothetical protein
MEEQFDAVLSVGPRSSITFSDVSAENCADPQYMKMRLGRLELMGMSGIGNTLKARCQARVAK